MQEVDKYTERDKYRSLEYLPVLVVLAPHPSRPRRGGAGAGHRIVREARERAKAGVDRYRFRVGSRKLGQRRG